MQSKLSRIHFRAGPLHSAMVEAERPQQGSADVVLLLNGLQI